MAAFDYDKARVVAKGLIEKFGQSGSVIKKGAAVSEPDQWGDIVTVSTPDIVISGTTTPLLQYKSSEIDGTRIKSGDSYVFFHSELDPEINMLTTVNGVTFRIQDMSTLDSVDGINIFRKLQLRR